MKNGQKSRLKRAYLVQLARGEANSKNSTMTSNALTFLWNSNELIRDNGWQIFDWTLCILFAKLLPILSSVTWKWRKNCDITLLMMHRFLWLTQQDVTNFIKASLIAYAFFHNSWSTPQSSQNILSSNICIRMKEVTICHSRGSKISIFLWKNDNRIFPHFFGPMMSHVLSQ